MKTVSRPIEAPMTDEPIRQLIIDLEGLIQRHGRFSAESDDMRILAMAAGALRLAAMITGIGECRRDTPYSPLRPVIDHKGKLKWCCTHSPEHCAP